MEATDHLARRQQPGDRLAEHIEHAQIRVHDHTAVSAENRRRRWVCIKGRTFDGAQLTVMMDQVLTPERRCFPLAHGIVIGTDFGE
ncbi:hypothetical protein D9M68_923560 [compost metagenome]